MKADRVSGARARLSYGVLLALLALISGWLVVDFSREADRIVAERSRLAIHRSQLVNRSFGDTFLAADYVLRDVLGRVNMRTDLVYPSRDAGVAARLDALLKDKVATVFGLTDLVLLNSDCMFVSAANRPPQGARSRQRFCSGARVEPGQSLHIQYMPAEKSVSGRPVVLMSRTVGSPEGVLMGAAMAVIDLEFAQKWLAAFDIEHNEILAIVDDEGTLLARKPALPEAIGRHTQPPAHQPAFRDVDRGMTFTAVSPIDGRERIIGLSKLERFPFVVMVGFDKASVLSGWQHRAWLFAVGYLVLSGLAVSALRVHLATRRQRERLRQLAHTDALTGMSNRRHIMDLGLGEFSRARRYGNPLSVLMLDIDKFKSINDGWGHPTGDRVLQELAHVMGSLVRAQDLCGRLGGEEFALILPETDLAGAVTMAERLRQKIEATEDALAEDGSVVRFTVSMGVASLTDTDHAFEAMLQRADKALYQAKEGGRNRVCRG